MQRHNSKPVTAENQSSGLEHAGTSILGRVIQRLLMNATPRQAALFRAEYGRVVVEKQAA